LSFTDLNLDPSLLRAIDAAGFNNLTEVQRQAIPVALQGADLMVSAQTGTGKTAAFVLPALQRLLSPSRARGHGPRVLVLTPTRELAAQVTHHIKQLGRFTRLRAGTIIGGAPYRPQERILSQPLDFLVATPGRFIDHMERGRVDFSRTELLILDEADRMLDMGFVDDVTRIAAATPDWRQTLLFSATLEGKVQNIAKRLLKKPVRIQVAGVRQRHDAIEQRIHHADNIRHKHALLGHLLNDPQLSQAVVFTATKRGADELAGHLAERGHESAALHGDMSQGARRHTLERMHRRRFRVLVATDVASRGLDIKGLSHVINFDLPMVAEDYVHRIGRTGRAGASGTAVSLVGPQDHAKLAGIERLTGQRLTHHVIPGLEPSPRTPQSQARRQKTKHSTGYRPAAPKARGAGKPARSAKSAAAARGKGGYKFARPNRSQPRPQA